MSIATPQATVFYPDSDGEPRADNTRQADEMIGLKTNLDTLFADNPDVFVTMDLLWYPVEGDNRTRMAPDVMVAVGRPKGYRGSYRQWEEGNIPLQVVFEILSPGNRIGEMLRKRDFYDRYGVEEYYLYDPERFDLTVWHRPAPDAVLTLVETPDGWVSPRLGIRFAVPGDRDWTVFFPDGTPFRSPVEVRRELDAARQEIARTAAERDLIADERDRLAARLRELGIDPSL